LPRRAEAAPEQPLTNGRNGPWEDTENGRADGRDPALPRAAAEAGSRHLVGGKLSYADLSLFQLVEGLRYAFPKAAQNALARTPGVVQLHGRIAELPKVAAYLRSERRIPFNEQGIFHRYPELDLE
jgi:hypothetical protein